MTPRPGASSLEYLRKLSEELSIAAAGDQKLANDLEALLEVIEKDLRRSLRVAKATAARTSTLDDGLAEFVRRLATAEREKTPPRGGRPKVEIGEETRRLVRRKLRADPKVGWRTICAATELSEWLAKRVLAEERVASGEETRATRGRKP